MSFPRISTLSLEYIRVPVKARRAGVAYDPTSDTVYLAITPKPEVNASDQYNEPTVWATGSWDTEGTRYLAKATVGPGGGSSSPGSSDLPDMGEGVLKSRNSCDVCR